MSDWYGTRLSWWAPLEAAARRRLGPTLSDRYVVDPACPSGTCQMLVYRAKDLDVIGDRKPVDVEIRFHRFPSYDTYGLPACDYPRVFAKPGATSKHRMPDDGALCLWMPKDPPERRWTHDKGLLELIELARQHLFLENYWRETDVWLIEDAPHGLLESKDGERRWVSHRRRNLGGPQPRPRSSSSR